MKKTLIALLALSSVAMAENIEVKNSDLAAFSGDTHAADRLDFNFGGSTDRTVSITTTDDATVGGTDGYGLNMANHLIFNITGTMNVTGTFKGVGSQNAGSTLVVNTAITEEEAAQLISSTPVTVSRDLVTCDFLQNINANNVSVTLTNIDEVENMTYGGMLAKLVKDGATTYYNISDMTVSGGYLGIADGAQAVSLAIGKVYGYVELHGTSGAAAKSIGFVAHAPEPATATLSLLALAGLAARRRRH